MCVCVGSVFPSTGNATFILTGFGVFSCASGLFMFPAIYNYLYQAMEVGIYMYMYMYCITCTYMQQIKAKQCTFHWKLVLLFHTVFSIIIACQSVTNICMYNCTCTCTLVCHILFPYLLFCLSYFSLSLLCFLSLHLFIIYFSQLFFLSITHVHVVLSILLLFLLKIFSLEYSDGIGHTWQLVFQTFTRFVSISAAPVIIGATAAYILVSLRE